jgi:tRNA pseudouridine65 synthase
MKYIAHPIIGDATHGNQFFQTQFGCHRLLLACTDIRFRYPDDGRPIHIHAPVGDQFAAVIREFGWDEALRPGGNTGLATGI